MSLNRMRHKRSGQNKNTSAMIVWSQAEHQVMVHSCVDLVHPSWLTIAAIYFTIFTLYVLF